MKRLLWLTLLPFIIFGYNNCSKVDFLGNPSGGSGSPVQNTSVGNPLTANLLAENIGLTLCQKISDCAPPSSPLSAGACYTSIQAETNIATTLGVPAGVYNNFGALINANLSGSIIGNVAAGSACEATIAVENCSSSAIQNIFSSGTSNLSQAASAIPASCASTFGTYWVYHAGVFQWTDLSYGGLQVNYASTAGVPLDGSYDISCTGNKGGFQPEAPNPNNGFDLTPYSYLTVSFKPTVANQTWNSTFFSTQNRAVGIQVNVTNFGPNPPVVGKWNTYVIPLGTGGYQLPPGTKVYHFSFQNQTTNQTGYTGPTNVYYVDDLGFY